MNVTLLFSIQMAMAIIMLIYVNLSSDTITWSDLTFHLIYVIHSKCHKKTITFHSQHTVLLKLAYELGYLSAEKLEYWLNRVLQMFVKKTSDGGTIFCQIRKQYNVW